MMPLLVGHPVSSPNLNTVPRLFVTAERHFLLESFDCRRMKKAAAPRGLLPLTLPEPALTSVADS
jgi:hypothetical protein